MLHEAHRTCAPSETSVSMSTAVRMVMCSDPEIRAPRSGWPLGELLPDSHETGHLMLGELNLLTAKGRQAKIPHLKIVGNKQLRVAGRGVCSLISVVFIDPSSACPFTKSTQRHPRRHSFAPFQGAKNRWNGNNDGNDGNNRCKCASNKFERAGGPHHGEKESRDRDEQEGGGCVLTKALAVKPLGKDFAVTTHRRVVVQ